MPTCVLPREYILAELLNIRAELAGLPDYTIGQHKRNGKYYEIVRFHDDDKRKEVLMSRASRRVLGITGIRSKLLERKSFLELMWKSNYLGNHEYELSNISIVDCPCRLDGDFFKNAIAQNNSLKTETGYMHNSFCMRSRAEVSIAKDLDAMGLIYKYEVMIPGTNKCADFLVYLPGLNICFFLEYLGRMDDESYRARNISKLSEIFDKDLVLNKDIVLMFGSSKTMPDRTEIQMIVNQVIYNHCKERVRWNNS